MEKKPDEYSDEPVRLGVVSGECCTSTYAGLSEALLTNKVMLYAYATSVVILAAGFVVLIITLAVLCFFYPEKTNAFLLIMGSPVLAMLIANIRKIKSTAKKINDVTSTN